MLGQSKSDKHMAVQHNCILDKTKFYNLMSANIKILQCGTEAEDMSSERKLGKWRNVLFDEKCIARYPQ